MAIRYGERDMDPDSLIARLEQQGEALARTFVDVPPDELRWKPADDRWSMLEVLGHLCDEETGDFRVRIRMTLEGAGEWPSIDPEGWVRERGHANGDPAALLETFTRERAASVAWLRSLGEVDWSASYEHPQLGTLAAGDLLAAWVAHDLLHLKQVLGLRVERLRVDAVPFSIRYAAP